MSELEGMRMFVAVVDAGSFSEAARRLGISVSAATRTVTALEATLGTALLHRSTRAIQLTDAGTTYYPLARKLARDAAEARAAVTQLDEAPRGTVRVTAPVALGRRHLASLFAALLRKNPALRIDLVLSDAIVNLREEELDVAIRIGAPEDSRLVARKLVPNRRVLCASPGYLASRGPIARPRDLVAHSCVLFSYAEADRAWRFRRGKTLEEVVVSGPLRANNAEVLREVVVADLGVGLIAEWLVAEDLAHGRLVRILPAYEAGPGTFDGWVFALFPRSARQAPKVRALVDHLARELPKCLPRAEA